MSDDTSRPDPWNASQGGDVPTSSNEGASTAGPRSPEDRVGFCQDCGKALNATTVRSVGTGTFCEPCLAARIAAAPHPSGYTTVPPYSAPVPQTNEPSPVLAAILGFIPGVGAMYNGQFAKGIVHLAVFAVLVSLSDNVNGIFGLFAAGWVFYMAFEAYHTAIARRDGLPLPNAFNLNDIGERMGFGKNWPTSGAPKSSPGATAPPAGTTNPVPPSHPGPAASASDWVGYVPPASFASAAYRQEPVAEPINSSAPKASAYVPPAYDTTFTGAPATPDQASFVDPSPAVSPARRFPTGALWLIGLGALILAANLLPDWKLTERWWPPLLFAGLSVWAFTRRMHSGTRLVYILRWPVILMLLALMLALHAAGVLITFGLICSVLLIAFGVLLLFERIAGPTPISGAGSFAAAPTAASAPFYPERDAAPPRPVWEPAHTPAATEPGDGEGR